MTKKWLAVVVGALAVASLVASPAALAGVKDKTPHWLPPSPPIPGGVPKAVCTVNGTVTTMQGVNEVPAHNHYDFVGTTIECPAIPINQPNLVGLYSVTASGDTDGPYGVCVNALSPPNCEGFLEVPDVAAVGHGETCIAGWSKPGGKITVIKGTKTATDDPVHFVRVGGVVVAWGELNWNDGKKPDIFIAALIFQPDPIATLRCLPIPVDPFNGKITDAILTGVAIVGNGDAGGDQGTKPPPPPPV